MRLSKATPCLGQYGQVLSTQVSTQHVMLSFPYQAYTAGSCGLISLLSPAQSPFWFLGPLSSHPPSHSLLVCKGGLCADDRQLLQPGPLVDTGFIVDVRQTPHTHMAEALRATYSIPITVNSNPLFPVTWARISFSGPTSDPSGIFWFCCQNTSGSPPFLKPHLSLPHPAGSQTVLLRQIL